MDSTGQRLKAERISLGLTQERFAAIGGVAIRAQQNYESGNRDPDATYFSQIAKIGADINYIITGEKTPRAFSASAHDRNVNEDSVEYETGSSQPIDHKLLAEIIIAVEDVVDSQVLSARWDAKNKAQVIAYLYKNYSAVKEKPRRDDPVLKTMIEVLLGDGWG